MDTKELSYAEQVFSLLREDFKNIKFQLFTPLNTTKSIPLNKESTQILMSFLMTKMNEMNERGY